jgi:leucokinin receptor
MTDYQTSMWTLILVILVYTSISIITVCGNSLTLFVIIKNKKMQDVTNCFISNLAIADIVIGLLVTPFQVEIQRIFISKNFQTNIKFNYSGGHLTL